MDSHIDYIYVTNHHNTFLRRKLLWKIYVTFWKPTSATFVNCFFISQSQVLLSTCPLEVTGEKYSVFRIQWFFMPALLSAYLLGQVQQYTGSHIPAIDVCLLHRRFMPPHFISLSGHIFSQSRRLLLIKIQMQLKTRYTRRI